MSSVPLPVRHRPRTFGAVVGQEPARRALEGMLAAGRVPPQMMFAGPSGCGKTTLARILATAVLCTYRRAADPCGACPSCRMAVEGSHPDLVEVDAASYGGKESILELAGRSALVPLMGSGRVFVVDEAHGLTAAAAQAFLKTLEEPSPGVHFFFCTTEPDRIIPTIRSRCVELHLTVPSRQERADLAVRVAAEEGWLLEGPTALALVDATDVRMGVRGVLNALARVAPVSAGRISPSDVALLLGAGPAASDAVVAAVASGDPVAALGALDVARSSVAEGALRAGFARWCRERLLEEFGSPRVEVWRRLLAELSRAEGLALDAWVVGAAHASNHSRREGPAAPQAPGVTEAAKGQERGDGGSSSSEAGSPESFGRLLTAASPYPDFLPELLGRCRVTESADAVVLEVPSRVMPAVEAQMPLLRTAAGRLGLPLRVVVA